MARVSFNNFFYPSDSFCTFGDCKSNSYVENNDICFSFDSVRIAKGFNGYSIPTHKPILMANIDIIGEPDHYFIFEASDTNDFEYKNDKTLRIWSTTCDILVTYACECSRHDHHYIFEVMVLLISESEPTIHFIRDTKSGGIGCDIKLEFGEWVSRS